MIKKLTLIFFVAVSSMLAVAPLALADSQATKSAIQCGVNAAAGATSSDCSNNPNPSPGTDLNTLIAKIINILSVLVGAVAVIMLIVAGFRFVASAGSDTAVAAARKTIVYALVGLLIVAVAQVVVHFVLNSITDTSKAGSSSSGVPASSCINGKLGGTGASC